jgi:short-subunit dehydrogenase
MYRVNKIFAPLLKEKGKVIMISSELAPLDPLPFTGLYGITKSTVEKYAYSLRMELQLLNKQVVLVRPGAVDTSFIAKSNVCIERFTNETKLYSYNAKRFMEIISGVEGKNIPPVRIADKICKILSKKKPKYVYKINRNFGLLLLNALPQRLQNYIIKKILTKK